MLVFFSFFMKKKIFKVCDTSFLPLHPQLRLKHFAALHVDHVEV